MKMSLEKQTKNNKKEAIRKIEQDVNNDRPQREKMGMQRQRKRVGQMKMEERENRKNKNH